MRMPIKAMRTLFSNQLSVAAQNVSHNCLAVNAANKCLREQLQNLLAG